MAGCDAVYNTRKPLFGAVQREAALQLTGDARKIGEAVGIPPFTTLCRGTVALAIALTERRARGSSGPQYSVRCAAAGADLESRMWAPWCWRGRWWLNLTSPVFAHYVNKNRAFEVECSASVPLVCFSLLFKSFHLLDDFVFFPLAQNALKDTCSLNTSGISPQLAASLASSVKNVVPKTFSVFFR